jgi:hypothetical protein
LFPDETGKYAAERLPSGFPVRVVGPRGHMSWVPPTSHLWLVKAQYRTVSPPKWGLSQRSSGRSEKGKDELQVGNSGELYMVNKFSGVGGLVLATPGREGKVGEVRGEE